MNYIDTVFWLRLEILDIFNSCANQTLIINLSNSCTQFPCLKHFPNFSLHKGKALENLVYNFFFINFFMFRLFSFNLCSSKYQKCFYCRKCLNSINLCDPIILQWPVPHWITSNHVFSPINNVQWYLSAKYFKIFPLKLCDL